MHSALPLVTDTWMLRKGHWEIASTILRARTVCPNLLQAEDVLYKLVATSCVVLFPLFIGGWQNRGIDLVRAI